MLLCALFLQAEAPKFMVGTVATIEAGVAQVKPDSGATVDVKLMEKTQALRVAPGEKDLSKAAPIAVSGIAAGDRVLVNFMPGTLEARRILVMSSSDIARRNEADRQDWIQRGIAGVVVAKKGNEISLRKRPGQEPALTVVVSDKTQYRRYAPDSVKFADAKVSSLGEVAVGDQLRARGNKSADGAKVDAQEVVFGTFLTKAGTVSAVDAQGNQVTVKDMASGKPVVVKLTGDSQLKKLPDFAGMHAGAGAGGMSGMDFSAMWERMWSRLPQAKLEQLKPGESVVVTSTKGASSGELTVIMLVGNADLLIRMFSVAPGAGGGGMGMGAMGGGFGLDLPGMIP